MFKSRFIFIILLILTFGEFNFYRPEGGELAKKSASSTFPTLRTMNNAK